jgi:hypothetical protein
MRKTIYLAIAERLRAAGVGILHTSLWNRNTEQLASGTAFRTPAVFVEFEPIEWGQLSMGARDADLRVRLHVVTRAVATPEDGGMYQLQALEHLDLAERINAAVQGFAGEGFNTFTLVGTVPDHEHDQLLHEELVYTTHVVDNSATKRYRAARPAPAVSAEIEKPRPR